MDKFGAEKLLLQLGTLRPGAWTILLVEVCVFRLAQGSGTDLKLKLLPKCEICKNHWNSGILLTNSYTGPGQESLHPKP